MLNLSLLNVVSHSVSTSNHNFLPFNKFVVLLYLIPFLHQTTTCAMAYGPSLGLYLIPFLHQTTTPGEVVLHLARLYLIPFLHQTTT